MSKASTKRGIKPQTKGPQVISTVLESEKIPLRDAKRTVHSQLAESDVRFSNWKWTGARDDFPHEPWLRTVDLCYPFAKGGALLVDIIRKGDAKQAEEARRKARALRGKKFRYLPFIEGMGLLEAQIALGEANIDPSVLAKEVSNDVDNGQLGTSNAAVG